MKIRFLSNYDIAKNLLNIINSADYLNSKKSVQVMQSGMASSVPNMSKNISNSDTFVKQANKEINK